MDTEIKIVQNDALYNLDFTLESSDGAPLNLTGSTIVLEIQNTNKKTLKFSGSMSITDGPNGKCTYIVQSGNFDQPGKYYAQIKITFGGGKTLTFTDIIIKVLPVLPK